MQTLDKLVSKYKLCVEYYDQLQDPIKFYFIEKIQQVLSEENTIKNITNPNQQQEEQKEEDLLNQRKNTRRLTNHQINTAIQVNQQEKSIKQYIVKDYSREVETKDKFINNQLRDQISSIERRIDMRRSSSRSLSRRKSLMEQSQDKFVPISQYQDKPIEEEFDIMTPKKTNRAQTLDNISDIDLSQFQQSYQFF